jgi:hypothetical protein
MEESTGPPVWDPDLAQKILGATMLVGVTYLHPDGTLDRQEQFYGEVVAAHPENGFCVALTGDRAGERFWLPPDPRAIQPALPGDYRLRATGAVVTDPDYTSTWTITYSAST